MVIAYHLIWTGYGWWLPNDPRGSGSHGVRAEVLKELGEVHYCRKRIQPPGRVVKEFYEAAHPRLRFDLLRFDEADRQIIAEAPLRRFGRRLTPVTPARSCRTMYIS